MEGVDDPLKLASWDLDPAQERESGPAEELEVKVLEEVDDDREKVIVTDRRKKVPLHEIGINGRWRAIVKLFMYFEKDAGPYLGTGWLIEKDIVVTAGHCVYDQRLGPVVKLEVWVGYQGRGSTGQEGVQKRYGCTVISPQGWVRESKARHFDISLVKLNSPFTSVTPLRWVDTPLVHACELGVIGYPGDKTDSDEKASRMYEMFLPTYFDRRHSEKNVLIHIIATFGGNSGGPVVMKRNQGYVVIGVHVSGKVDDFANKATPLGPPETHAIPVGLYRDALQGVLAPDIQMVPVDEVQNPKMHPITNGTFQCGTLAPWSVQQLHSNTRYEVRASSEGYSGYVLCVTGGIRTDPTRMAHSAVKISQVLRTKAGVVYDICLRHRYGVVSPRTENTYVNMFIAGDYLIQVKGIEGAQDVSDTNMVEIKRGFEAKGPESLLDLNFYCTNWEEQEYFCGGVTVTERRGL